METSSELLQEIIVGLKEVGTIEACAIVSRDGLVISTDMPEEKKADSLAAMSATMLGAAETISMSLGKGLPGRVIVESENGKLICTGAGPNAILVVMAQPQARLSLIIVELEKAAAKLKKIV